MPLGKERPFLRGTETLTTPAKEKDDTPAKEKDAKERGALDSSNSSNCSRSSSSSSNSSRSSNSSEWQAILYLDARATGRLLNPTVRALTSSGSSSSSDSGSDLLLQFSFAHSLTLQQLLSTSSLNCTLFHIPPVGSQTPRTAGNNTAFTGNPVATGKRLAQAIYQQQQRIDYICEQHLRKFKGAGGSQLSAHSSYTYTTGDGPGSTALTFQDIKQDPCLSAIHFTLALPRQQLDGTAMSSMSAPTSLRANFQQQQPQQQPQQHHEPEQAACTPGAGGRDGAVNPQCNPAASSATPYPNHNLQGYGNSTNAGAGKQQVGEGKSRGGSPPNGTSASRTHRRPEAHGDGRRSPQRGSAATGVGPQQPVEAQQAPSTVVQGGWREAHHDGLGAHAPPKGSQQQGNAAGAELPCAGASHAMSYEKEGPGIQLQLPTNKLEHDSQSSSRSRAGAAWGKHERSDLREPNAVGVSVGVNVGQYGSQKEDLAVVMQNGKVRNGVIAYGGGGGALLPHGNAASNADRAGLHSSQAEDAHVASAAAMVGGSPTAGTSQEAAQPPGPAAMAQHGWASLHAGANGSGCSSSSPPSLAQHRGSTRSEPPSHACSPPRAHRPLPEQQQQQQQQQPHPAILEQAGAHNGVQGPGCSHGGGQRSDNRGLASLSMRHSVGDVGGSGVGACSISSSSSSTGQQQGRGDEGGGASTSGSGGGYGHRIGAGEGSHAGRGGSSTGGPTQQGRGTGHSHSFDGSSGGGGGGGRSGGWGQQGASGGAAGMPLSRGRGSRGSSGSLSSAGGGGGGGGKHGGGYSHHPRGGQSFSPRWNGGGGGASGRLSMDEMLLAQSQQQLGNGPHLPPHRSGSQVMLDSPGLSTVSHEPAASADLERFLVQVTPMINVDLTRPLEEALPALSLEDVWRFYYDPSLHGREVYTLGGARGPSVSYFVPYLSAMQLFTPASPKDPGTNRLYVCDTEGWPKHMHLRFEHLETELPFNRAPLYDQIDVLAQQLAANSSSSSSATPNVQAGAGGAQGPSKQQQQQQQQQQPSTGPPNPATSAGAPGASPEAAAASSGGVSSSTTGGGSQSPTGTSSSPASAAAAPAATAAAGAAASTRPCAGMQAEGTGAAASGQQGFRDEQPLAPPPPPPQAKTASQLPASLGAVLRESQPPGPSLLRDMRIAELHPASWYAVAWYPVYRIPDAPLVARFLTFHSFAPLVTSIQNTLAALQEGQQRPMQLLPVGVVGLKWYNMHNERWLEALHEDGPGGQVASAMNPDDPSTVLVQGTGGFWGGYGGGRGSGPRRHVQAQQMDIQFQAHLSELQATAERLARGHGLRLLGSMGSEELRLRHPDFEFFNSRS